MMSRGFTLIETLIALVLAATAASVILAQVWGLYKRAEQERSSEFAATRLLNDLARISPDSWPKTTGKGKDPVESGWRASGEFELRDAVIWPRILPAGLGAQATITNFSLTLPSQRLPAVDVAFTPFQRFDLDNDRYAVSILMPAMPVRSAKRLGKPVEKTGEDNKPAKENRPRVTLGK